MGVEATGPNAPPWSRSITGSPIASTPFTPIGEQHRNRWQPGYRHFPTKQAMIVETFAAQRQPAMLASATPPRTRALDTASGGWSSESVNSTRTAGGS